MGIIGIVAGVLGLGCLLVSMGYAFRGAQMSMRPMKENPPGLKVTFTAFVWGAAGMGLMWVATQLNPELFGHF